MKNMIALLMLLVAGCNDEQCNKNAHVELAAAKTTFLSYEVSIFLSTRSKSDDSLKELLFDRTAADAVIVNYIDKRAEMGQMLTCTDADVIKEANGRFSEIVSANKKAKIDLSN